LIDITRLIIASSGGIHRSIRPLKPITARLPAERVREVDRRTFVHLARSFEAIARPPRPWISPSFRAVGEASISLTTLAAQ
jgi:hypothetical protein